MGDDGRRTGEGAGLALGRSVSGRESPSDPAGRPTLVGPVISQQGGKMNDTHHWIGPIVICLILFVVAVVALT